jgi:hypothetical protein
MLNEMQNNNNKLMDGQTTFWNGEFHLIMLSELLSCQWIRNFSTHQFHKEQNWSHNSFTEDLGKFWPMFFSWQGTCFKEADYCLFFNNDDARALP